MRGFRIAPLAVVLLAPTAEADIITGAGAGSVGGHVKAFDGATGALIRSFFAYDGFGGGARVGSGDVTGDGVPDIITGAGPGAAGGHVKVFDGATGALVRSFLAFDGFDGGVYVAGTPEVVPQAVHGPSSVLLLTVGGLGLALQRRRRAAGTRHEP
jgi:hypothetical protein